MGIDIRPSLETQVLGQTLSMPVMLAPMGMIQLCHPDGAVGVARAAANRGTIAVLSRTAQYPMELVAKNSPGPYWYQITSLGGRDFAQQSMEQAREAGYTTLVVTLDGPPPGNRQAEKKHGVMPPVDPSIGMISRLALQALARPGWLTGAVGDIIRQRATVSSASKTLASKQLQGSVRFTWADVQWIKSEWHGNVLVKGLLTGDDARKAVAAGVDGIIVSNHGGRALDSSPASLVALPEVVAAVGDCTEVLVDGGFRWAGDVVKALCLGAKAVFIGRPFAYGLACAGQPGVERILELLHTELERTLRLMGCPTVAALNPSWLQPRTSLDHLPEQIRSALVARVQ